MVILNCLFFTLSCVCVDFFFGARICGCGLGFVFVVFCGLYLRGIRIMWFLLWLKHGIVYRFDCMA